MLAVKISDYRGNVINQKSDDNKWYLEFIRNPNISSDAKIVFLNLRTNDKNYNENIKSLMFKCNLSENLVSKALKELEILKLVSRKREHILGRYQWQYITNIDSIQYPKNKGVVNKGIVTDRYKYNKNINKTNDDIGKNHHEISDLENVENSIIEFADKSDSKKAGDLFDESIYNSGVFNFPLDAQKILSIKLDNIPKSIKKNNLSLVSEVIKMFPEYAKKTNEGLNPKGKFTENEMLTYFKTILASDCKYPKWFNDLYKQEEVKKQVNNLEDSWKSITNIWKAKGNRIDDSIKIMIKNIMEFIQDYEYHKKNNLAYDKNLMTSFNTSINQTLSKKSVVEMMDIIKEYTSKNWLSVDPFKKQINSFLNDGLTLETIKKYFDSRGIQ